jgi:uncharacterized protein YqeY
MLKEKISADYMSAFRSKNTIAKNLLSVIKGEIQTQEKNAGVDNLPDEEVTKILTKTLKSLKETQSKFPSDQTTEELAIVESYLPKQMNEMEITTKIQELIALEGASNIADIMRAFSKLPADRQLVSTIYQTLK